MMKMNDEKQIQLPRALASGYENKSNMALAKNL
jgi:hypothetical protein